MALGRQARGGLRLTVVRERYTQEMHNFQKPLEGSDVMHRLLGISTCKSLLTFYRCFDTYWGIDDVEV